MKRSLLKAGSAAALLGIAFGIPTASAEGEEFTAKSIEGRWGFSGDGLLAGASAEERLPIAGIGVVTFDGVDSCEIAGLNNLNGTILEVTSDFCSYSVNPDGTGISEASFPAMGALPSSEVPVFLVIVDGGEELRLMQGAVIVSHFVARRINGGGGRYRR